MKDERIYEYLNNKITKLNEKYEESKKTIYENEIEITELKNEISNLSYNIANFGKAKKVNIFSRVIKKFFSKNSKISMIISLLCHMLVHPIRAMYLVSKIKKFNYHTGDFLLDILYLKNGKINLTCSKKPMVSIVIPVYNQIEFTYKCLKSRACKIIYENSVNDKPLSNCFLTLSLSNI